MPEALNGEKFASDDYHGIFAKIKSLNICDGTADLYEQGLADFYNSFLGDFVADIPLFERFLPSKQAKVLDLACGAGRIGMALARNGVSVDGLELSQAMLDLAHSNLANEPAPRREQLRFFQGDITDFALPDRYDLIVLGVTSISLLLKPEQRKGLFSCVRNHLNSSGKFIFDILDLDGERWKSLDNFHDVWSRESDDGVDFGIIGQKFYPERRKFVFNVYRELIDWNGETRRIIGKSVKAWLDHDQLASEMAEQGLMVSEHFSAGAQKYFVVTAVEDGSC